MEAPQRLPAMLSSPAARSPLPPRLAIKYCRLVAVFLAIYRTYRGSPCGRAGAAAPLQLCYCSAMDKLSRGAVRAAGGAHVTASPDSAEIADASRLDGLAGAGGLLQRRLRPVVLLVLSQRTAEVARLTNQHILDGKAFVTAMTSDSRPEDDPLSSVPQQRAGRCSCGRTRGSAPKAPSRLHDSHTRVCQEHVSTGHPSVAGSVWHLNLSEV